MKRGGVILIVLAFVILIAALYLTLFYTPKCQNLACWEDKLVNCKKASFEKDSMGIIWNYKILGEKDGKCVVNVKVIEIKEGLLKVKVLEGKSMVCLLPLGVKMNPESDPSLCTGKLKEEMQTIIIEKLHEYILKNVGNIGDELKILEGVTGNSSESSG